MPWNLQTAGAEPVEIVRPRLHHLAALGESLCLVVGRSHFVALGMRQLAQLQGRQGTWAHTAKQGV